MELTPDDVKRVAELARIELTEDETRAFVKDLNDILRYVNRLQQVDTEGVEPAYHVVPLENVMRVDCVTPSLPVDEALDGTTGRSGDYFKVPRILDVD
ncbi:MAG: Asp-tRNA(Asn)/Glu-tRNA(Gln) amidotransferase subunit GatC [Firmicutes bacterium]|nr:Asp-tRNA(Asn)/Glu-tRNA(Gln) amidotransferase subunit GatC [Bacillota bacterium]